MDDRAIIDKILSGDLNAFKVIIDEYQRLVGHVVYKMVPNAADQEEICQEVFIKVYEHLKTFEFQSKLSTWIARIAYNTCLNHVQKRKLDFYDDAAMPSSEEDDSAVEFTEDIWGGSPGPDELLMNKEVAGYLKEEIKTLPVQYRAILTLYHLDELSYEEIGNAMDLPAGTVKSYLFRARRMLKEKLLGKYKAEELLS